MKQLYILLFLLTSLSMSGQLVLNETLYDPPSGDAGDANGDGTRSASEDEFIEFVNNSNAPLDISGFKIYDAEQFALLPDTDEPNHTVPANTIIPANGIYVLFGGGTPTGIPGDIIQVSTSGNLNLNNAGDVITVTDSNGDFVLNFDPNALGLNMGTDQSAMRNPNITGDFVLHTTVNNEAFSPGVLAQDTTPDSPLVINEVLFDPAADAPGDANGDGVRDALDDEFIEIINTSSDPIDISGYSISDASELRHTFPASTILQGNGILVVFGGGTPTGDFGGATVQTASEGQLNLSNSGDIVTIRNSSDDVILVFDSASLSVSVSDDQSVTRSPEITGDFVLHTTANASLLFSPGTQADGGSLSVDKFKLTEARIYPNPNSSKLLRIDTNDSSPITVMAFDLLGKNVIDKTINTNELDISGLKTGMYLLRIIQNGSAINKKLIVE